MLVQAQSPGNGVGETVHLSDSALNFLDLPKGKKWGEGAAWV